MVSPTLPQAPQGALVVQTGIREHIEPGQIFLSCDIKNEWDRQNAPEGLFGLELNCRLTCLRRVMSP
jgi:hypothetical protein